MLVARNYKMRGLYQSGGNLDGGFKVAVAVSHLRSASEALPPTRQRVLVCVFFLLLTFKRPYHKSSSITKITSLGAT